MQDDVGMSRSHGTPWAWFPLAMLLALSVFWAVFDSFSVSLDGYLFVPLLTGWLASRYGPRIAPILLALGLLSVVNLGAQLLSGFSLRFGIPLWIYILSIATAIACARPWGHLTLTGILSAHWRWLKWLALVAVWLAVFKDRAFFWKLSETFQIGFNPGFVLLMPVLAASVKWSGLFVRIRAELPRGGRLLHRLMPSASVALLGLAFLVYVRWLPSDTVSLGFGFPSGYALVPVAAFLLAAFGVLDWRLIVVLLGMFFASGVAVPWLGESFTAIFQGASVADGTAVPPEALHTRFLEGAYFDGAGLTRAVAAVLLGVAMAPFWQHQRPDALRTGYTPLFLFLALLVLFFGMPAYSRSLGNTGLLLVGGAAYVMGLRWQVRGIIAGPLLIQMMYLLALVVSYRYRGTGANPYELVNIGLIAFPFAFFGLLSNRYALRPADAPGAVMQDARP